MQKRRGFYGGIVLELSTSPPPEPFAALDGADGRAYCLHSKTTASEMYCLEEYIVHESDGEGKMELAAFEEHRQLTFWAG